MKEKMRFRRMSRATVDLAPDYTDQPQMSQRNGYVGNQFVAQSSRGGSEGGWTDHTAPTSAGIAGFGAMASQSGREEAGPLPRKRGFEPRPLSEHSSSPSDNPSAPRNSGNYRPLPVPPMINDSSLSSTQSRTYEPIPSDQAIELAPSQPLLAPPERIMSPEFVRHEDAGGLPTPQGTGRERIELPPLYGDVPSGTEQ